MLALSALLFLLGPLLVRSECLTAYAADAPPTPPDPSTPLPVEDPSPFALSTVVEDPEGEARASDGAAAALLSGADGKEPDPVAAAHAWMDLADRASGQRLPAPPELGGPLATAPNAGLWWPVRDVVAARLSALPPAGRAAVERRWGTACAADLDVALRHRDTPALVRAARRAPMTAAGGRALLLLGDHALVAARPADAAQAFDLWLRSHPGAPRTQRAAVAARWLDACVALRDERGVTLVSRRSADLFSVPVTGHDRTTLTLADRVATAIDEIRTALRARGSAETAGLAPPTQLAVLFEHPTTDPGLLPAPRTVAWADPARDEVLAPTCAVAVVGPPTPGLASGLPSGAASGLVVVSDRRAERLNLETGRVEWSYPQREFARTWPAVARYRPYEVPTRAAVAAGDLVLVVLGDAPPARTATFRHRGVPVSFTELGHESRTVLVALSATDGRPRWTLGGLDDPHPVTRAEDVGVASPPTVSDGRVYVVLSARRSTVESWLACLDLATGRPRFVTPLSRGDSGLALQGGADRALFEERMRAIPRALPPAVDGDEILVAPGAGYATGVSVTDGVVRWVRALPRYRYENALYRDVPPVERSFHPSLPPIAVGGVWLVGAPDAPVVVGIERGTGRLRFTSAPRPRPEEGRADAPPLVPDAPIPLGAGVHDGRFVLRLAGYERALDTVDVASGQTQGLPTLLDWPRRPGAVEGVGVEVARGRPHLEGTRVVAARGGTLRTARWPTSASPGNDASGDRSWREDDARPRVADGSSPLPEGDVLRVGDRWIVVGRERLVVVGDRDREEARARAPEVTDAFTTAARACRSARWSRSRAALAAAVRAVRAATPSSGPRDAALERALAAAVEARLRRTQGPLSGGRAADALDDLDLVDALEASARADAYAMIGQALVAEGAGRALVALVDRWVPWGAAAWVRADAGGRVRIRSDLFAAEALLPFASESTDGAAALEVRGRRARAALSSANSDAALAACADAFPGTVAAFVARVRRLGLAVDRDEVAAIGTLAADLRTRRTAGVPPSEWLAVAARVCEAESFARTGDRADARTALHDARSLAPALARVGRGTTTAALDAALRADTAWVPDRVDDPDGTGTDVAIWGEDGAPTKAAQRAATALAPTGPGAGADLPYAVLRRGVHLAVLDLRAHAAPVALSAVDAGFAGLRVGDLEAALSRPGVRVLTVSTGGPAERGGLAVGDVIDAVDGVAVTTCDTFLREIGQSAGRTRTLSVSRAGRVLSLPLAVEPRPEAERAASTSAHAYVREDGVFVVATPAGLASIHPDRATMTSLWRFTGPGVVRDLVAAGGTVFVWTSHGPLREGYVIAVDPVSGVERWRTAVTGSVVGVPRAAGSALVVDVRDPDRTVFLDRTTGGIRASHARSGADAVLPPSTLVPFTAPPTTTARGLVVLLRDGATPATVWVVGVDPASGWQVGARWIEEPAHKTLLRPRLLASGGLVALASTSDEFRVLRPRLNGTLDEEESIAIDGAYFERLLWGMLEGDSRIAVAGDHVHIVRTSGDRRASVGTVAFERRALRDRAVVDPAVWHPARRIDTRGVRAAAAEGGRPVPWSSSVIATPEGAWVTMLWLESIDRVAETVVAWWEPDDHDRLVVIPVPATMAYAQPPVRVGRFLLLRTDAGFRVIPLRRAVRD